MSMKENVDFIKDGLNSEEKFLESVVKVESFYKKYKVLIIGLISIGIIAAVAIGFNSYNNEKNKTLANIAFQKVISDSKDTQAINTLKETNNKLYEVAMYLKAKKDGNYPDTNITYLKELSEYKKALTTNDVAKLNELSMKSDFLLKEFAIFNKALVLVNEGKYKEAKVALSLIPKSSKASELSTLLEHYLLTK